MVNDEKVYIKNVKPPSVGTLLKKIAILVLILGGIIVSVIFICTLLLKEFEEDDDSLSYKNSLCRTYYDDEQYGQLYYILTSSNLYDEEYEVYWEIVNGYIDYMEYGKWLNVTEEQISGSTEKIAYYRQKVIDNAKNCKYQQNKQQLNEYVDMIKGTQ